MDVRTMLERLEAAGVPLERVRRVVDEHDRTQLASCGRSVLDCPVRVNRRFKVCAGRAHEWKIELNPRLYDEGLRALAETFVHELAHVVAGIDAAHGPRWKATMQRMGLRPDVYHAFASLAAARTERAPVAVCDRCGYVLMRRRALARGRRWEHKVCGGVFVAAK